MYALVQPFSATVVNLNFSAGRPCDIDRRPGLRTFAAMRAVFARISAGLLLAGAVVLWLPSAVAQPAPAAKVDRAVVHAGDSQAVIIDKLGRPAILQAGNRTFLMYPEGRIVLEDNRAVAIPPALLAPASTPDSTEVAPSAPPIAGAVTPVAAAPTSPTNTAPAKPPAAAVPVAPTKPATPVAQPSAVPAETTHSALAWVPMWAWAIVGIVVVFGGLKAWDTLAQRKNAAAADSASEDGVKSKAPGGPVRPPTPNIPPPPMMEEEPYVAPTSPAVEPVRPKITIPLRPAPDAPVQTTAASKPAEPAPAEAPRIVRLSRKPSGPTGAGEGKI
jgi:hypothetical protein